MPMPTNQKKQRRPAPVDPFDTATLASPQDEKAFLAYTLNLVDRAPDDARAMVALAAADQFTIEDGGLVFQAIAEALKADKPAIGDVALALRRAQEADHTNYTDAMRLVADLASVTVSVPQAIRLAGEAGKSVHEYYVRRRAMRALADSIRQVREGITPEAVGGAIEHLNRVRAAMQHRESGSQRLALRRASDIECTAINWLWPQRMVGDGLTIITGPVGISKSLISVDVAARVTTGGKWPDGTGHAPQGSVILFGAEDDAGKVVVPRLAAAGADLARVHVCQGAVNADDGDADAPAAVILERHIEELRAALDEVADCRLIVFDPLPDYIAGDENNSAEVRRALVPLARLAQERNVAVLAVLHQNKKNDLTTVQRIAGSGAFAQIARVVLSIGTHPEDADKETGKRRIMLVSKNNYGQRDVGQAYEIETRSNGQPGLVWQAGLVTMDADEIARRPTGGREHEERRGEAVDALRDLLADGEQNATTIMARLQDAGLGRRQIEHAKKVLNVIPMKRRDGWYWRLPANEPVSRAIPQPDPAFAAWAPEEIEQFNRT
jgi:putative DNA primase/helicase